MAKKQKLAKKEKVGKKASVVSKVPSKDIEKKKQDEKSISNVVKKKKSPDKKKSIDNKVIDQNRALDDAGYVRHLLEQQENMLDYSKLFSHLGGKKDNYNSYDAYSLVYGEKAEEEYEGHETISNEVVDRIIQDSIVENLCGFSLNRTTLEEKEAFKIYAMFNQSFIQLKYSFHLG